MSDSVSAGCPRCRDYEDLKRELENQKERLKEKQNKDLLSCEKEKKVLQKRVLQLGAAAVIGGTLLGKEFIDSVASYIESFNAVSNVLPSVPNDLISSSSSSPDAVVPDESSSSSSLQNSLAVLPAQFFYSDDIGPYQLNIDGSVTPIDLLLDSPDQEFDFLFEDEPEENSFQRLSRAFSAIPHEEPVELALPPLFDFVEADELPKIEDLENYVVVPENYAFLPLLMIPFIFIRPRRR